jgi:hypothetical protein
MRLQADEAPQTITRFAAIMDWDLRSHYTRKAEN